MNYLATFWLLVVFSISRCTWASDLIEAYQNLLVKTEKIFYNDSNKISEAMQCLNDTMKIEYPNQSNGEKEIQLKMGVFLQRSFLEEIKRDKNIKAGCFVAAALLVSLVVDYENSKEFLKVLDILKRYNLPNIIADRSFLASVFQFYYLSPNVEVLKILQDFGITVNQGYYLVLTSHQNQTFAGLSNGMENLDLATWKKKAADNWQEIIKNWHSSKHMLQEADSDKLCRIKLEKLLTDYGGLKHLADPNSWLLHKSCTKIKKSGSQLSVDWGRLCEVTTTI